MRLECSSFEAIKKLASNFFNFWDSFLLHKSHTSANCIICETRKINSPFQCLRSPPVPFSVCYPNNAYSFALIYYANKFDSTRNCISLITMKSCSGKVFLAKPQKSITNGHKMLNRKSKLLTNKSEHANPLFSISAIFISSLVMVQLSKPI